MNILGFLSGGFVMLAAWLVFGDDVQRGIRRVADALTGWLHDRELHRETKA